MRYVEVMDTWPLIVLIARVPPARLSAYTAQTLLVLHMYNPLQCGSWTDSGAVNERKQTTSSKKWDELCTPYGFGNVLES